MMTSRIHHWRNREISTSIATVLLAFRYWYKRILIGIRPTAHQSATKATQDQWSPENSLITSRTVRSHIPIYPNLIWVRNSGRNRVNQREREISDRIFADQPQEVVGGTDRNNLDTLKKLQMEGQPRLFLAETEETMGRPVKQLWTRPIIFVDFSSKPDEQPRAVSCYSSSSWICSDQSRVGRTRCRCLLRFRFICLVSRIERKEVNSCH